MKNVTKNVTKNRRILQIYLHGIPLNILWGLDSSTKNPHLVVSAEQWCSSPDENTFFDIFNVDRNNSYVYWIHPVYGTIRYRIIVDMFALLNGERLY